MGVYNIKTTQNVDLEFEIASIGDRILGLLIDSATIMVYCIICITFFFVAKTSNNPSPWFLLLFLPVLLYSLLCELFLNGQTVGKMVMKIRVVRNDGKELGFGSCFIRWIFRIVDFNLTFGMAALLTYLFSQKGQRLGDIAASTTVLKIESGYRLTETAYVQVPENYTPRFPQVTKLSDADIQTIKEVLLAVNGSTDYYSIRNPHPLIIKTIDIIKKNTGIDSDMPHKKLLITILRDYTFYHQ